MAKWRTKPCSECDGRGIVPHYSGVDFLGPKECPRCGGSGVIHVPEKDRLAQYPGGALLGTWPGKYAELGI